MARCANCGQSLRDGDRFCMRCGTERGAVSGPSGSHSRWEYARIAAMPANPSDEAPAARQTSGPGRGANRWVYEAKGQHPERGVYAVRRSPTFLVADGAFGPTFDWNGRLEGQEALSELLKQLRDDGWQLLADQRALDLLLSRSSATGLERAVGEAMRREDPVWSQLTLRRPTKPQ